MNMELFSIKLHAFINLPENTIDLWIDNTLFDENDEIQHFKLKKQITAEKLEKLTQKFHFEIDVKPTFISVFFYKHISHY